MREYLAALDKAAGPVGQAEGEAAFERVSGEPAPAKSLSLTDPASAWTSKGIRKVSFAYGINYLVDLKRAIVVDVAATPARRTAEVATTSVMIERTQRRFGLAPSRISGDAASGTSSPAGPGSTGPIPRPAARVR